MKGILQTGLFTMIAANSGHEERDKIKTWLQVGIFVMIAVFFFDWLLTRQRNSE